jgi:hypothetical protein
VRQKPPLATTSQDVDAEYRGDYEEKIKRLELEAHPLDPGSEERVILRYKVVACADSFVEGIDGRPALVVSDMRLWRCPTRHSKNWFFGIGHIYQASMDPVRHAKMGLLLHDAPPSLRDHAASRHSTRKQTLRRPRV